MKFNICLLYPTVNSIITLKSMYFYHKTSNATAKLRGLTQGAPEVIAAIIHNVRNKSHKKLKFNIFVALPSRQFQDYIEIQVFLAQDV